MITIPNRTLFTAKVFNYTKTNLFIFQDINLLIDFNADREKACQLAYQITNEFYTEKIRHYQADEIKYFERDISYDEEQIKPIVWCMLDTNGIRICVRFFSKYDETIQNSGTLKLKLYNSFKSNYIQMVVPSLYINVNQ